jgi:uncharacterized protein YjbI with pentapeptide repeats
LLRRYSDDPIRKNSVINFLIDSNIFSKLKISLSGANLKGASLVLANLSGAELSGAGLNGATLALANLSGANLSGANLSGADLSGANLSGADLREADLRGANLSGANLSKTGVVIVHIEDYDVYYHAGRARVGCQYHTLKDWHEVLPAYDTSPKYAAVLEFLEKLLALESAETSQTT